MAQKDHNLCTTYILHCALPRSRYNPGQHTYLGGVMPASEARIIELIRIGRQRTRRKRIISAVTIVLGSALAATSMVFWGTLDMPHGCLLTRLASMVN